MNEIINRKEIAVNINTSYTIDEFCDIYPNASKEKLTYIFEEIEKRLLVGFPTLSEFIEDRKLEWNETVTSAEIHAEKTTGGMSGTGVSVIYSVTFYDEKHDDIETYQFFKISDHHKFTRTTFDNENLEQHLEESMQEFYI
ncbi:hypothetical protein [Listeria sp. ILCC797]|uniref:hypothetical protein n=1 Tax=Listeria sp. ILCC797 TaxID=1918333 RepID=UPI00135653CD|nr:hypothetical protein [Listeria sp. ILCC797]